MARGLQGAMLKALGSNDHVLTVLETSILVPGFQQVRFASETLFDELDPSPANFIRLWVPDPANPSTEHQRAYTVVDPDPDHGTLTLQFVLHDPAGPAATWAARCGPGDELVATVYGSTAFKPQDLEPAGYLLVGDAASTPAINSILAVLPHHLPVEVFLEWGHETELAIPIADHPHLTVHRVARDPAGTRVVAELTDRDWSDWYGWVGAERMTTKAVKAALREVHGFPKSELKAQAYWVRGKALGASRGSRAPSDAQPSEDASVETVPTEASSVRAAPPAASSAPVSVESVRAGAARWRSQAGTELLDPIKGRLKVAGVLAAVTSLAQLVPFVLLAELGRRLLAREDVADQWPLARVALIVLGVAGLATSLLLWWLHLVDARFALDIRRRLLTKLSRLPLGWFTEREAATIKQTVTADTASLHYLVTHAVVDVVGAAITPLAVLVYLFVVDARLAFVLLLPIIAYLIVFSSMVQASGTKVAEASAWAARVEGEAVAFVAGLPVVRMFGGADRSSFRRSVDDYASFLGDWQRPFVSKKATAALITSATTFLWVVVAVGGVLVIRGWMSPTDLLPFLVLGTTFGPQLLAVAYGSSGLRDSSAAARRIGITLTEPELATAEASEPAVVAEAGRVSFRGVTFGYRPGQPVVHDVDLDLEPGTVTALVGPSGSGKSTLAALVARFHDPDLGTVSLDGVDIREVAPDDLYRSVGFVLQDVQLVRGTLHENVALARHAASRAEVVAAAEAAGIHDRIERLQRGYDSVVGEDVDLSGGEAQRVTIARAILADPRVLVLDEATAFADPESEHRVQQALGRLMEGRTVLVIAHRLHTVVDADQIVVLDEGRVAQRGHHVDLLAEPGRYRDLWRPPLEVAP